MAMWLITPYMQDAEIVTFIGDLLKRLSAFQAFLLGLFIILLGTLGAHIFSKPETKL